MFIDTKGLGSSIDEEHDRSLVSSTIKELEKITNIYLCILFVKKDVRLSGSFLVSIEDIKPFMDLSGPDKDKVKFKTILTYCDLDSKPADPANDDQLLSVINNLGYEWSNSLSNVQR